MRITRLGQGVDATGRLAPEAIERTVAVLARVPAGPRPPRRRPGADDGHVGRPRRRQPRRLLRRRRGRRRRAARSCWAARRRPGCRSSAPPPSSTRPTARSSWSTSAAGPPSSPSAPTRARGRAVDRHRLRPPHREVPPLRPARPRGAEPTPSTVVRDYLDDVARDDPRGRPRPRRLVGLAGTVTTVAAVELGLATYDRDRIHHFRLTREAAEDVFRTLATETRAQRVHNPGLEEARADVIVGGAVILVGDHALLRLRRVPGQRGRHPRRARAEPA